MSELPFFRAILRNVDFILWAVDMDGIIRLSEGKGLSALGLLPGQLVGQSVFAVYEKHPEVCEYIRQAMLGEEFIKTVQIGDVYIENRYAPARDENGKVIAVLGASIEVSERFRILEERERKAAQLRVQAELLDLSDDAIMMRKLDGTITYWNRGAEQVYGYSSSAAIGQVAHELLQAQFPEPREQIEHELLTHGVWSGELVHKQANGTEVLVSSRWRLKRNEKGVAIGVMEVNTNITARREAERLHAAKQEELIRTQSLAIAELSTPLIPIANEILVMPLVGMMDASRAQRVMESLLDGLSSSRGKIAILDITGVALVDTQVANSLIRAAKAGRLLGAEVILTGIRAEVAQTLVAIGADLGDITTCGSLQAGISYALKRLQKSTLE